MADKMNKQISNSRRNAGSSGVLKQNISRSGFIKTAGLAVAAGISGASRAQGIPPQSQGALVTINNPAYPYPFFIAYDPKSGLTAMFFAAYFGFDEQGGIVIYERLMKESVDVLLPPKVSEVSVFPGLSDISKFSGDNLPVFVWTAPMEQILGALFTQPQNFPFPNLGLVALGLAKATVVTQLVRVPRGTATMSGKVFRYDLGQEGRVSASVAGPLIADPGFGGLPNQLNPDHIKINII